MTGTRPILDVRSLSKVYGCGETTVRALDDVTLGVGRGEYVAVVGSSGAGKSTLLAVLACLDTPTGGAYLLDGIDVSRLTDTQLARVRNRFVGLVLRAGNLIPRTSAVANVELPLAYAGVRAPERRRRALSALDVVGLADRAGDEPHQLSAGRQQRVAVARALVTDPAVLLADEPTGNLDDLAAQDLLGVLDDLHAAGRTIVLATHEHEVGARAGRLIRIFDGRVAGDKALVRT